MGDVHRQIILLKETQNVASGIYGQPGCFCAKSLGICSWCWFRFNMCLEFVDHADIAAHH